MAKKISHLGIVQSIDAKGVLVRIESAAACGACHAKGSCTMSGAQEKLVQVRPGLQLFEVGEQVNVVMRQSLGRKAVMLAYVMPLVVLVASLLLLFSAGVPEGTAGLLSLCILAVFYVALYLFRNKLDKEFSFDIEKISTK
jgi:sigma-E factor negative regulatory protein RseC